MSARPERAISLVEKGWAGARQLTIAWARQGIRVRHLIAGRVPADLRAIITPHAGMVIAGVPRRWYRWAAWWILLTALCRGAPAAVLVDNEHAARWVSTCFPGLRGRLLVIEERPDGAPRIVRRGDRVNERLLP